LAKSRVAIVALLLVAGTWLVVPLLRNRPSISPAGSAATREESGGKEAPAGAPTVASATAPADGRMIFLRDCAHCHGPRGDGISPNMRTLHPAPFDLTAFELAGGFIERVVRDGYPGSDMPGWKLGTDDEVRAVSAYTAGLGRSDVLAPEESYAPPEALREAGRRIYTAHCVTCHGEQGRGDGPDAEKHLPRPASFAEMRPAYSAARRIIQDGVKGTDMPSWPLLTAPEIQAVTFYIRTLYTGSRDGAGVRQ
jgi:mono/diheme cytochrome c family protein